MLIYFEPEAIIKMRMSQKLIFAPYPLKGGKNIIVSFNLFPIRGLRGK
jgi:hypothetical protein